MFGPPQEERRARESHLVGEQLHQRARDERREAALHDGAQVALHAVLALPGLRVRTASAVLITNTS